MSYKIKDSRSLTSVILNNENNINDLDTRLTTAEEDINNLDSSVTSLDTELDTKAKQTDLDNYYTKDESTLS